MKRVLWPILVSGLIAVAGCSKHETAVQAANRSGTLIVGNGAEPEDLDPQSVTAYTDQNILVALFDGLTEIDEATSQAVPGDAESWSASPDGRVWTFHLRAGLTWSNGEPLTADDFVQSWKRILSPELGAEYSYLLYPIKGAEGFNTGKTKDASALGMAAPDARTVQITLERPIPYLPALVAAPPWFPVNVRVLAKFDALKRRGTGWTKPGNLVGNGPFVLKEWRASDRILVERNPNFWDAKSNTINQVVFLPTESPDVEEHDFRAGQVHVTFALPSTKIAGYRQNHPDELRVDPFLQTYFLRFNVTKGPLGNPKVRRALSLAIDREAISRAVLMGSFPPATSFTPPGIGTYASSAQIKKDFSAARALLAEAGFPGGKGLPSFEVQARNDEVQPKVLEAIQAEWKQELGVTMTIASLEQKTWVQNQQTLNYTISTAGWAGDFLDPITFLDLFVTGGGNNWTGWGDKTYDELIDDARQTPDAATRTHDFETAEARLLEEAPIAPLYYGARAYLIDPQLKGWPPSLLGFHRYTKVTLPPP